MRGTDGEKLPTGSSPLLPLHVGLQNIYFQTLRRGRDKLMKILLFFVLGFFAAGCSHTYKVTSDGTRNSISAENLNKFLHDKECTIVFKDETTRNTVHVAVTSNSIRWQDSEKAAEESESLAQIDRLEVSDKTRGFVDALFVGTVGAAILVFFGPRGGGDFLVKPAYPEAATVFVISAGFGAFSSSTRRFLIRTSQ